jgi:chorismate-pyruvate lyase
MNPHDELRALTSLFPTGSTLFERVDHVPAAATPEPYRTMLAHDHHMTLAMEEYHQCAVDVEVLAAREAGDLYVREILLHKQGTTYPVQFGIVRFHFQYVTAAVREEIVAGEIPLGKVLIRHNVLRQIDLGAILLFTAGPGLAERLQMPTGAQTYGRLATIFCNQQPAVDLLEISRPLP